MNEPVASADPQPTSQPRLVAVLTCFNRKALTLACLEALERSAARVPVNLEAVLVDDASPDGTGAEVCRRFPWVEVIEGTGALYWNRGMHLAFERAMQRGADYYLWLNDDTHLVPEALESLLAQSAALTASHRRPAILVGATAERENGKVSYGGRVATSRLRPFNYRLVYSDKQAVPCEAIEGNCVLITRAVAERVGNLDPVFEHAMGDTDYGLRARAVGIPAFVASGVVGHCSQNPLRGSYFDTTLSLATRWKLMRGRKGLPMRSWLHFCRRHGGFAWPVHFAWPYAKLLLSGVRGAMVGRPAGAQPAKLT